MGRGRNGITSQSYKEFTKHLNSMKSGMSQQERIRGQQAVSAANLVKKSKAAGAWAAKEKLGEERLIRLIFG